MANSLQSSCRDCLLRPASSLVRPFAASNSKDRIFVEMKTSVMDATKMGRVLFSEESKYPRQRDSRRVFIWRESGACFHSSYITKIDDFVAKEPLCVVV
ncbi:hypothetical protein TNCV_3634281 [Trichonephila clavipes]|nr:hypothetical protein TNCV_3634281 [Trichonephila clavipes]